MAADSMARNDLVGVRFAPAEQAVLERLVTHFEEAHPGMRFNKQMVIRAAVFAYAEKLGIEPVPPAPASMPRAKTAVKKR